MLLKNERDDVITHLSNHVGLTNSMGALITIVFSGPDRVALGNLPLNLNTVADQAVWVVDACLSSRWNRNPSLLEQLLTRLINQGGIGSLAPIRARVRNGVDPNPDPFQSLWVLADQPFLARGPLRTAARSLVEDVNQPILRVNGPSLSGKTYTTELLSFVMMESRPDLHVVPVELAPGTAPMYEVEELADSLALSMSHRAAIPARSNSSYPRALVRWLISTANQNSGIWIFVLDGFGQPNVRAEVLEFIQGLAQSVSIPEHARKLRLVLLHFDQPLTGNWRARTVDDGPLLLDRVTSNDLVDCLTAFNSKMKALNKTAKMIDPAEIPKLAAGMIANWNQTPGSQLPFLYQELLAIARA